ncbi:ABC transporter permease [Moraxella catarrhalis]|uniref:heme exporter protein CcmB n=1 Tax=Moraxella catarrhalis TaxID=480 RepID=UPI00128BFECE|nr:heme exporter protein CcmB [Moraxella catarrhalis]MPX60642.1 ABC transporter permease [Moraxella catarrhalis]
MMTHPFLTMITREWQIKRQGTVQWLYPLVLFLLIITLFPLAIGNEPKLLLRLAPSAVWIAALLALVIGVDDLFRSEFDNGTLAQMVVAKSPLIIWVLARLLVHWLFSAGVVAILSLLVIVLFEMPFGEAGILMVSIFVGSPILLGLSAIASSLTLTLKNGAVLVPLIALPMQLPVLIFATGAVDLYATGLNGLPTLALLAAGSIITVLVTPWVIASVLKMAWAD